MKKRIYVMVPSTEEEKAEYREVARRKGFTVAGWFRWLAKRDMRLTRNQDRVKE